MSELSLLYVTSFNKALYHTTGKKLIQSFIAKKINNKFLITYEDEIDNKIPKKDNFILYNLAQNKFLEDWLNRFKHIIPQEYGGTAAKCTCKINTELDKWNAHKFGCAHSQWNRRASKWFRKIVALCVALSYKPEKIIFLDSDVYFTKHLPERIVNGIFKEFGFIYHYGKYRQRVKTGIESGVIGFSREGGGFDLLNKVIDCFDSGEFLNYKRWDDGYIFKMMLDKTPKDKLGRKDLVLYERRSSHVVNLGLFRHYLIHNKGWHTKKYGVA